MKNLTRTPLAMIVCVSVATMACGPGRDGQKTSAMREDDEHVATADDKAMAEGQPRPLPAERPTVGEDGKPPYGMAEDVDASREATKPPEGPVQLEEPRPEKPQPQPKR